MLPDTELIGVCVASAKSGAEREPETALKRLVNRRLA
jgi:hypothetical protein